MPLVYMNSWASLALRAAALVAFGVVLLAGPPADAIGACALLLAASAAHPLSVSLRLGASGAALSALAEGVVALVLAATLAIAAGRGAAAVPDAAALVAPLAPGLVVLALACGLLQHARLHRLAGARARTLPVATAGGAAATALLAALALQALAAGLAPSPGIALAAFGLAAWIMHRAMRLRRARRTALRALQRDRRLGRPARPDPDGPLPTSLDPAGQWS
jgi:hypothetical protein